MLHTSALRLSLPNEHSWRWVQFPPLSYLKTKTIWLEVFRKIGPWPVFDRLNINQISDIPEHLMILPKNDTANALAREGEGLGGATSSRPRVETVRVTCISLKQWPDRLFNVIIRCQIEFWQWTEDQTLRNLNLNQPPKQHGKTRCTHDVMDNCIWISNYKYIWLKKEHLDQEYTWPSARAEVSSSQPRHFQSLPRCGRELRRAPRDRINEMLTSCQTKNKVLLSSTNLFCWRWRPCSVHLVKWGENKSKSQAQKCTKYAVENHLGMSMSDLSFQYSGSLTQQVDWGTWQVTEEKSPESDLVLLWGKP